MKIRTQFIIGMAIFSVMLLIIATLVIITSQRVEQTNKQEAIARELEQQANELSYLSGAYLLHNESQQLSRWEAKFASFSNNLTSLNPSTPEQQAVVNSIKTNQERLKAVFAEIGATLESTSQTRSNVPDLAFIQVSWSRMEVQNQGMIFDATRLALMLHYQAEELRQTITILSFALIGVLGAFLLASYALTQRRILRAIAELQDGTAIIGSGNLDFAIAVKRNDEIGQLARAFNRMAANLKGVTATKAELEREIAERTKAEEEIRQLNQSLAQRATEFEASNKELEAFAYSVSHDLRAPLRHINGFGRILLDEYADSLDERAKGYLEIMRQASQRMGQLIDDLLNLSRVTRAEMRREDIDLSKFAELILVDLRNEQPERQVEVVIAPGVSANGDPYLLRIVLDNLLGNAWKFTAKRSRARIEFGLAQHDTTVYFVKDNGAGFDVRYADRLFAPFQRLHRAEEFPGTGIGLATVQRIVHRHGGRVWADGAIEQGATFYFTLSGAFTIC